VKSKQEITWPKPRPVLTEEQQAIFADWYRHWLSEAGMQGRYSLVDRFGHQYAARTFVQGCRTLDMGAGNGGHLKYEDLDNQIYTALESSELLATQIQKIYPQANVVIGDCQKRTEFQDNYFDRILAIHLLEHLDNLPSTLNEVCRTLRPGGRFSVVIPCEGGFLYRLGRKFSSEKMFVARYHQSYDWLIKYDHINTAREVLVELAKRFHFEDRSYFPFLLPILDLELVIGMTCIPIK